jgi:hypothetical protein
LACRSVSLEICKAGEIRWRDLVLDEVVGGSSIPRHGSSSPNDEAGKFVTLMALGLADRDEQVLVRKEKMKKSQRAAMDEWGSSLLLFMPTTPILAKGVARATPLFFLYF